MKYHPDRNQGDKAAEHKFKEINEAYDVLKDDQKRAAYDRYGHAAFENGNAGGRGFGGFDFTATGFADIFDEMFGEFIGGGAATARKARARGADLRYNMTITLQEAFAGKQTNIRVPGTVSCEACQGSGGEKGAQPVSCSTCRGAGRVRASQGFFTVERTCQACGGSRQDHRETLQGLQRRRPRAQGEDPVGEHPGGRRGRHAHPAGRRRRDRHARRAAGRSLYLPLASPPIRFSSARATTCIAACRFR